MAGEESLLHRPRRRLEETRQSVWEQRLHRAVDTATQTPSDGSRLLVPLRDRNALIYQARDGGSTARDLRRRRRSSGTAPSSSCTELRLPARLRPDLRSREDFLLRLHPLLVELRLPVRLLPPRSNSRARLRRRPATFTLKKPTRSL